MSGGLEVLRPGPLATLQDRGRPGHRATGVSPSGAADRGSYALANHLVGNRPGAAAIEVTLGGLWVRAVGTAVVALAGAPCAGAAMNQPLTLPDGGVLRLGTPSRGLRTYLALAGGIDVAPVLGSRSTDTLSGLGPAPLRAGDVLVAGGDCAAGNGWGGRAADGSGGGGGARGMGTGGPTASRRLALIRGPRDDWLSSAAWEALDATRWTATPMSNRVAVRLEGAALAVRRESLPPEPLVRGAVQVPPDGQPILFLADHPVTGGYPVIGVLTSIACDGLAQVRPGSAIRLTAQPSPSSPRLE